MTTSTGWTAGRAGLPSQPLWVRRSTFQVDGLPLLLQEVFLPQIGLPGG